MTECMLSCPHQKLSGRVEPCEVVGSACEKRNGKVAGYCWLRIFCKKVKSKGVPRHAEVDQGVPGRLRPRIFLTFRHCKGGRSSAKHTGRLYPRRNPRYFQRLSRPQGTWFCRGVPREKSPVTPPGIDPETVRLVSQRLNHSEYSVPDIYGNCN